VDAARGALIAIHNAAGLTRGTVAVAPGGGSALLLLRTAEGLCRMAMAMLQQPTPSKPVSDAAAYVGAPRRPRGKKKKAGKAQKKTEKLGDTATERGPAMEVEQHDNTAVAVQLNAATTGARTSEDPGSGDATNAAAFLVQLMAELLEQWQTKPPADVQLVAGSSGKLLTVAKRKAG